MGIQSRRLNLTMKLLLTALFCGAALALPNGRVLRPEEHWRPAGARDLSKYQARPPPCQPTPQTPTLTSQEPSDPTARADPPTRQPPLTSRPSAELRDPNPRTESSEDSRPSPTSGPGKWLCSLTTPGSVEAPSSPRTTSCPPLTVSMAPATTTSWPEPTTSESPPSPTELKSPHSTDGTTHNELVTATGWGKPSDNAGGISP